MPYREAWIYPPRAPVATRAFPSPSRPRAIELARSATGGVRFFDADPCSGVRSDFHHDKQIAIRGRRARPERQARQTALDAFHALKTTRLPVAPGPRDLGENRIRPVARTATFLSDFRAARAPWSGSRARRSKT